MQSFLPCILNFYTRYNNWMLNECWMCRKGSGSLRAYILFRIQTYMSCITSQAASRMFAQSMKTLSQLRNYGIGELNLIYYTEQYAWPWNEMHLMDWTFRTFWQKLHTDMSDSCELNKITLTRHDCSSSLLSNAMIFTHSTLSKASQWGTTQAIHCRKSIGHSGEICSFSKPNDSEVKL